jgi:hypothetical protein
VTLEAGLVTRLSPLVSGRIAPAIAQRDMGYPMVTYQRIDTEVFGDVMDLAVPGHERIPMQIDCWSDASYNEAVTLAEDVRTALFSATGAYDGDDVIIVRFAGMADLPELASGEPLWRRSLTFNFVVRR